MFLIKKVGLTKHFVVFSNAVSLRCGEETDVLQNLLDVTLYAMRVVCVPCGAHIEHLNPDRGAGSSESGFNARVLAPYTYAFSLWKRSKCLLWNGPLRYFLL